MGLLDTYHGKRDFGQTPEPADPGQSSATALRYSMQKHDATRLHWDLRLEWQGVLLSWAVTRGPSADPSSKRLAVRTEDHPLSYLTFEGVIPKDNYGAGTVMLWDIGHWQPFHDVADGLAEGHLHFALHGRRNTGNWSLVRMKGRRAGDKGRETWLMVKDRDAAAEDAQEGLVERHLTSVATGRDLAGVAAGAPAVAFGPDRKGAMPRFRAPQLATAVKDLPEGAAWLHEVKHDGYRAQVAIGRGGARIFTRSGLDWSDRFSPLLPVLAELPAGTALIDGEIVAGAGLQGFAALQAAIQEGGPFRFYVFDLLHLNGADLAPLPQTERRAALEKLLEDVPARGLVQLSPAIEGEAAPVLAAICEAGGEGIISKLAHAPWRGGRSTAWLKVKCSRRAEFVICGYQPSDKRGRAFASLLLATREGDTLVYRGKVGTGFDDAAQQEIAERLAALARPKTPLEKVPAEGRGAKWVRPELVAEVVYAEVTPEGRLRHARFIALREDKPAVEVQMETEIPAGDRTLVRGTPISSPDRVIFPKPKTTKLDLARYYDAMADRILPTLADRPASLLRLPSGLEGERFFQKHAGKGFPKAIRSLPIEEKDGGTEQYIYIADAEGLVAAAQMGTVEFHPWGARRDRLDRPERLVFDLDPDEGLGFAAVRRAAFDLRGKLEELGLGSWPMVSGGKGVHVIVPLRRTAGWDTVKLFAQLFATLLASGQPDRYTATMAKAARKGRIFIDWLRNERGATAIAPFSVRARPGAPVAVPVSWDELARLRRANGFGLKAAQERAWSDLTLPADATLGEPVLARLEALREKQA
ncbi:DNA ligase D [Frigidibacter mobilis]|uniref:DNA ligase (ATP) n=1 Tax=Frigidibacter mobilis TaxID=1335048 RepID=A0A165SRM4_9RHOB|nr:DNA ligase D [Frigidibacter mobilis]AMY70389.1 DNA ligase D [Frigidibacter mobilis]